jgi:hypothetical protein
VTAAPLRRARRIFFVTSTKLVSVAPGGGDAQVLVQSPDAFANTGAITANTSSNR